MGTNNSLFILIESLTAAEKTYLRRNVFPGGKVRTAYCLLFEVIESQASRKGKYDESAVKKNLALKNFTKNFAATKNYLYDLILMNLYEFHSRGEAEYKSRQYLKKADVLIKKGLFASAKKFLKKAQVEIIENDFYAELIRKAGLEKKISNVSPPDEVKVLEEKIKSDIIFAAEKIKNAAMFNYLFKKLHSYLLENPMVRNDSHKSFMSTFFREPLLQSEDNALTFESKLNYFRIYMNYSHAVNKPDKEFEYGSRLIEYIFANSSKIRIHSLNIYRIYLRFLICTLRAKKYDEFFFHLQRLRNIHAKFNLTLSVEMKTVLIESYGLEMNFYNNNGEFDRAVMVFEKFQTEFLALEENIHMLTRISFYYNISVAYFGEEMHEKSLFWINKVLNNTTSSQSGERYFYSLILALIVNFELKNLELTESYLRKIYRILYKKNKLFEFEKQLMKFMRKLPDIDINSDLIKEFRNIYEEFRLLMKDPYERVALEKFEFLEYLESKIKGKPFAEVYREKLAAKQQTSLS